MPFGVSRRWVAGGCTVALVGLVTVSVTTEPQREAGADAKPAFEVATVKLAAPDAVRNRVTPTSPNRLVIPGMTLTGLGLVA